MNIRIIRGQDQIGGSIIEVSSAKARIVLDVGAELDEAEPAAPPVEGFFSGTPAYDGVFITHYHGDHMGLADRILPGIPVWMGEGAAAVDRASAEYMGRPPARVDGFLRSGRHKRAAGCFCRIHMPPSSPRLPAAKREGYPISNLRGSGCSRPLTAKSSMRYWNAIQRRRQAVWASRRRSSLCACVPLCRGVWKSSVS